jgi:predicted CoA-binding protein
MPDHELETARPIVAAARRIAVVGLSPNPARPSHGVASYLQRAGYEIVPVRPGVTEVLGEPAHPDIVAAAATGPIDVVDVFRRSQAIGELVPGLLAARPKLVWLQMGIRDDRAAEQLRAAGIVVVQDHCLKVAHLHWGL